MTCWDKSIVGQIRCRTNSGGVSDIITVGIADINSCFVGYQNCDFMSCKTVYNI